MAILYNPYMRNGKWYWYDEAYHESVAYDNKIEALVDMELHGYWLTEGKDLRPAIIERWAKELKEDA